MALKIFKGIWFFSLLGLLVTFFYVYASLPEQVALWEEGLTTSISKNGLFYLAISLIAFVNVLVFIVTRLMFNQVQGFYGWFYGLITTINIFFIATLLLLYVLNSGERYDYSGMAPAIYGSLFLVAAWIIGWPIYAISQKITSKQ